MSDNLSLYVETARAIAKARQHSKVPCRLSSPAPRDRYAPAPKGCQCKDRAGYRRMRHEYDRDERCVWCGRPQAMYSVDGP